MNFTSKLCALVALAKEDVNLKAQLMKNEVVIIIHGDG
jgi:hypothetical protein